MVYCTTQDPRQRLSTESSLLSQPEQKSFQCNNNYNYPHVVSSYFQVTQSAPEQKDKNTKKLVYTDINERISTVFSFNGPLYLYSNIESESVFSES